MAYKENKKIQRRFFNKTWGIISLCLIVLLTLSLPAAADIGVRSGKHTGYTRIVFDWTKTVGYEAALIDSKLHILFSSPDKINISKIKPAKLAQINKVSTKVLSEPATLTQFDIPKNVGFNHFRLGHKVVIDIYDENFKKEYFASVNPETKKETASKGYKKQPVPKQEKPIKTIKPEHQPIQIAKKQMEPVIKGKKASKKSEIKTIEIKETDEIKISDTTPPAKVTKEELAPIAEANDEDEDNLSQTIISVSTLEPANLAVFKRFGYLWVVLDSEAYSIPPEIFGPMAGFLGKPETFKIQNGIAYRFTNPPETYLHVEKEELNWQIVLSKKKAKLPPPTTKILPEFDQNNEIGKLTLPLLNISKPYKIKDPVVGDTLFVFPVHSVSHRIDKDTRFHDLIFLKSGLGIVIRPLSDKVGIKQRTSRILITAPNGLTLTPGASAIPRIISEEDYTETGEEKRLFDFPSWQQGGPKDLLKNKRIIEQELVNSKNPHDRAGYYMRLALLHFANRLGPETLGYLKLALEESPEIGDNPSFFALKGAANALSGKYNDALKDLSHPTLQLQPEAKVWKGFAAAASEQWKMAERSFPKNNRIIIEYPPSLAIDFTVYMAESALRLGKLDHTEKLLGTINTFSKDLSPRHRSAISYLWGEYYRQNKDYEKALKKWKPVVDGRDRLYHSKASFAVTALELQENIIERDEAIEELDRLKFAWRGDGLEIQTLHKIGLLKIKNNLYHEGLMEMRKAVELAKGKLDDSSPITQDMTKIFNDLFVNGKTKDISPLEAVSIYREFSELEPPGPDSVLVSKNIAEHLIQIDLLKQASNVLEKLLKENSFISPMEKSRAGTRLAYVYLLMEKPNDTLAALQASGLKDMPADLQEERELLRAKALADLKMVEKAIATLSPFSSGNAQKLKADIYWNDHDWNRAADALKDLLPSPSQLDDKTAGIVLNSAIAYHLAKNTKELKNLKARYSESMSKTKLSPTFSIVTRNPGKTALQDYESMLSIAAEVDMFRDFMDVYNKNNQS